MFFNSFLKQFKYKKIKKEIKNKYNYIDKLTMKDLYKINYISITIMGDTFIDFLKLVEELNHSDIRNIKRKKFIKYNSIVLEKLYRIDGFIYDIISEIKYLKNILIDLKIKILDSDYNKTTNSDIVIGRNILKEYINIIENFLDNLK